MNFLEVENKLSDFDSFSNVDPLTRVSYNADHAYDEVHVQTQYNLSCDMFRKFITEKVFKVSGGDNYVTGNNGKNFYASNTGHLAGTFLSWKIKGNDTNLYSLNMGILIEETLDNNGDTISKVGIELREQEPLMQTIIDCTGKVYDFKGGVKFSDFKKFINQTKYDDNLVKYDVLYPTNLYKKDNTSGVNAENGDSVPDDAYLKENKSFDDFVFNTNIRGYLILCSFVNDTEKIKDVDKLLACKPVITVIRIVDTISISQTDFMIYLPSLVLIGSNYIFNLYVIGNLLKLSKSCVLNQQFKSKSIEYNYYILGKMITPE